MVYGGGFPLLIKVSNKLIPWFGDEDQAMERYLRRRRERRPPKATWPVQVKQNIWKKNTLVNLNQLKETAVNFWTRHIYSFVCFPKATLALHILFVW